MEDLCKWPIWWCLPAFVVLVLASGVLPARATGQAFDLKPGQRCLDCHGELNEKKTIHPATEGGAACAGSCHKQDNPARHQFTALPQPIGQLCLECHDDPVAGQHRHKPAADGECIICHNPHQSEQAKLLREAIPDLCFTCHGAQLKDSQGIDLPPTKRLFDDSQAQLHPPFAEGDCLACHRPHASDNIRLLVAAYPSGFYQNYSETAYALCLSCHDAEAFTAPRTLTATAFRNGNLNLHVRHVNKEKGRGCRACHSPHGSRQPHLIVASFRFGERTLGFSYETTDNGGSCAPGCHVKVVYDRLAPINNLLRATPRAGKDASVEELRSQSGAQKIKSK